MRKITIYFAFALFVAGCGEEPAPSKPEVREVNPTRARPGQMISITGIHFGTNPPDRKVLINGTESAEIVSWSDNLINVKIPQQMLGDLRVVVQIGADKTKELSLTIEAYEPNLTDLQPARGWGGEGAGLMGQYFGKEKGKVLFGELEAEIIEWADEKVSVRVPAVKADVDVTLKTAGGVSTKTAMRYRFLEPSLTSVAPLTGIEGVTLTLKGNYFGDSADGNEVLVGKEKASIISWSMKSIEITVPKLPREGKSVPVQVFAHGGKTESIDLPLPQAPTSGPMLSFERPNGPFGQVFIKKDGWPILLHTTEGNVFSAEWDGFSWVPHATIEDPLLVREIQGNQVRMAFGYGTRAAMDPQGVIHAGMPFHFDRTELYGRLENGTWKLGKVIPDPPKKTGMWRDVIIDPTGKPVIAIYTEYFGLTLYRPGEPGQLWTPQVVTTQGSGDTVTARVDGQYDASGSLHLVYFEGRRGELIHALQSGNTWKMTTLDSKDVAGAYGAMAIDPLGRPNAVYQAKKTGELRHALLGEQGVKVQTLDPGPAPCLDPWIAFDKEGHMHVVYHQMDSERGGVVKYVTDRGGSLKTTILMEKLGESSMPTLTFDDTGRLYIVHGDRPNERLFMHVIEPGQEVATVPHPAPVGTPSPKGPPGTPGGPPLVGASPAGGLPPGLPPGAAPIAAPSPGVGAPVPSPAPPPGQ